MTNFNQPKKIIINNPKRLDLASLPIEGIINSAVVTEDTMGKKYIVLACHMIIAPYDVRTHFKNGILKINIE